MWQLVSIGLQYHFRRLVAAWFIGTAIVLSIVVLQHVTHERDEDVGWILVSVSILISSVVVCFVAEGFEARERRLLLQLPLPVRLSHIAWARVLLPSVLLGIGVVVADLLLLIALTVQGMGPDPSHFLKIGFVAGQLLFFVQLPLTIKDLTVLREEGRSIGWLGFGALALMGAVVVTWLELEVRPGLIQVSAVGTVALLLALMNVATFKMRRSFTT